MDKLDVGVQSSEWQLRRYRRFNLECPVRIKIQSDTTAAEVDTVSRNVSIGGLLLRSPAFVAQNVVVTFMMSVQGIKAVRPIHLVGKGQIVRVENAADATFLLALRCQDPVTELEVFLPM